jgi:hypothetical protein
MRPRVERIHVHGLFPAGDGDGSGRKRRAGLTADRFHQVGHCSALGQQVKAGERNVVPVVWGGSSR